MSITLAEDHPDSEIPLDLQEEFDEWDRAGSGTIELVERLADEWNLKKENPCSI